MHGPPASKASSGQQRLLPTSNNPAGDLDRQGATAILKEDGNADLVAIDWPGPLNPYATSGGPRGARALASHWRSCEGTMVILGRARR